MVASEYFEIYTPVELICAVLVPKMCKWIPRVFHIYYGKMTLISEGRLSQRANLIFLVGQLPQLFPIVSGCETICACTSTSFGGDCSTKLAQFWAFLGQHMMAYQYH